MPDPLKASAGETILVVDDDPHVRMVVVEALEELGYAVLEAADGAEGLGVLKSGVSVDLLVSDVRMPGMDGPAMVEAGRVVRPQLKVVFVTGYSANLLAKTDFDDRTTVLNKPFQIDDLAAKVRKILR